jgi:hypothetical protein
VDLFAGHSVHVEAAGSTRYGLVISNSQDVKGHGGAFRGGRHGITTGGNDSVGATPCRNIVFDGSVISNANDVTVPAADWHGNTEKSSYQNCVIYGGAIIQGRLNHYLNCDIYQGSAVSCIQAAEILEFNFSIQKNRLYPADVASEGRGRLLDVGGNSSPMSAANTIRGGTLVFKNNEVFHYNEASINTAIETIRVRNTGYVGTDLECVFEDNTIIIPDAAKSVYRNVTIGTATSGTVFNRVSFKRNTLLGTSVSLEAATVEMEDVEQGNTNGNTLNMKGILIASTGYVSVTNVETNNTAFSGLDIGGSSLKRVDLSNICSRNACRVNSTTHTNRAGIHVNATDLYMDNIKITSTLGTAITITGAVDNGSGLIRLTAPAHGLVTNNGATVADVTGTVEANNVWVVTVIDADTLDLVGSTFVNLYTGGGTVSTSHHPTAYPSRLQSVSNGKVGSWLMEGYPTSVFTLSSSTLTAMNYGV